MESLLSEIYRLLHFDFDKSELVHLCRQIEVQGYVSELDVQRLRYRGFPIKPIIGSCDVNTIELQLLEFLNN